MKKSANSHVIFHTAKTVGMFVVSVIALSAQSANLYFKPAGGAESGLWGDLVNWWVDAGCTTPASALPKSGDNVYLYSDGTTAVVSETPSANPWSITIQNAMLQVGTRFSPNVLKVQSGAVLDVKDNGVLIVENQDQKLLIGGAPNPACVTNCGTILAKQEVRIGDEAGVTGFYVQNGGNLRFSAATADRSIYIGAEGLGIAEINAGCLSGGSWGSSDSYSWPNPSRSIIAVGGTNTVTSTLTIEEAGAVENGLIYVGGSPRHLKGRGEIFLRGGSITNSVDNGNYYGYRDSFFIGGAIDTVTGSPDPDCYGTVRGWGRFSAKNASTADERSFYVRLGYGEIVADGEGEERDLSLLAVYQVTNCLPSDIVTESGWRARNKGRVLMCNSQFAASGQTSGSACVGCSKALEMPDLVNSVRISATRSNSSGEAYLGVNVLASDRSDAHCGDFGDANVIGVWQIGAFTTRAGRTPISGSCSGNIRIRYDGTKIRKANSKVEILRWTDESARWISLGKYEQTANCVISIPEAVESASDAFCFGTFVAVERSQTGFTLVVR